jgi:hypothetical protein
MTIPACRRDSVFPCVHEALHLTGHGRSVWPMYVKIKHVMAEHGQRYHVATLLQGQHPEA